VGVEGVEPVEPVVEPGVDADPVPVEPGGA